MSSIPKGSEVVVISCQNCGGLYSDGAPGDSWAGTACQCGRRQAATCKVIQVIVTTLLRRGSGKSEEDPIRIITQYWSLDGELLAEIDPTKVIL